jgi:hypothetical protein
MRRWRWPKKRSITVEEFLEPSEDCAYFRVSGDFVLEDNPDKTLGYYMFDGDESQRDRDIALLDTSFEKKQPVYMLVGSGFVEKVEAKCR